MAMTSHRPGTVALQTAMQLESMVLATALIDFNSLHSLLSEIGSVPNDSDLCPDAFGVDKSSLDQPDVVTKPDAENKDVDETDDDDDGEENDDNDEDSDDEDDDSGDDDEDGDDDDDDEEESSDEDGETDDDDDDSDEDEEDDDEEDDEEEEQNLPVFKKTNLDFAQQASIWIGNSRRQD